MPDKKKSNCVWRYVGDITEAYKTDCGELFQFTGDGPIEHGMKYCCYCGKPIEEGDPVEEIWQ